jgi:hypothetical protein
MLPVMISGSSDLIGSRLEEHAPVIIDSLQGTVRGGNGSQNPPRKRQRLGTGERLAARRRQRLPLDEVEHERLHATLALEPICFLWFRPGALEQHDV